MITLVFMLCASAMKCSPPETVAQFPLHSYNSREETRSMCQQAINGLMPGFRKAVSEMENKDKLFAVLECR